MRLLKQKFAAVALVVTLINAPIFASEGVVLDRAPLGFDNATLQQGAKLFVNYCLGCHGASALRYRTLTQIGLSEEQIRDNLMFTADKVREPMMVALRREDGRKWFGAAPPDLSLIARARASADGSGADWLYTYLRQFYRDDARPTGWNNVLFPGVGMPHALWELQGEQQAHFVDRDDGQGKKTKHLESLEIVKPGLLTKEQYDQQVASLVSFLTWMGEPGQEERRSLGWAVLAVLGVFAVVSWMLKRAYWKDVH